MKFLIANISAVRKAAGLGKEKRETSSKLEDLRGATGRRLKLISAKSWTHRGMAGEERP